MTSDNGRTPKTCDTTAMATGMHAPDPQPAGSVNGAGRSRSDRRCEAWYVPARSGRVVTGGERWGDRRVGSRAEVYVGFVWLARRAIDCGGLRMSRLRSRRRVPGRLPGRPRRRAGRVRVGTRAAVLAVAAVLVVGAAGCGGSGGARDKANQAQVALAPAKPPPPVARLITARLVSRRPSVERRAIAAALSKVLPAGRLLPRGSQLQLDARGWRETGRFADSTGVLRVPGRGANRVEVGFIRTAGGWRVTFVEPAR
jgi:hypothetical protein